MPTFLKFITGSCHITHRRQTFHSTPDMLDFEISMMGPGEDWIYATALSNRGGAFLGAYSGKIIEIDHMGDPVKFFDIGCAPRKII